MTAKKDQEIDLSGVDIDGADGEETDPQPAFVNPLNANLSGPGGNATPVIPATDDPTHPFFGKSNDPDADDSAPGAPEVKVEAVPDSEAAGD